MPGLPPSHTAATDPRTNALKIASAIRIELWNLQQVRPQLRGSHNMIENLLVRL